jgi:hypothetical protein
VWDAVEKVSWLAGILSLVVAVVGVPKLVQGLRNAKQAAAAFVAYAVLVPSVVAVTNNEWATGCWRRILAFAVRVLDGVSLPLVAAWPLAVLLAGGVFAAVLLPVRVSLFQTRVLTSTLQPVVQRITRESPDRRRSALEMQRLQRDFKFNPLQLLVYPTVIFISVYAAIVTLPANSGQELGDDSDWPSGVRADLPNLEIFGGAIFNRTGQADWIPLRHNWLLLLVVLALVVIGRIEADRHSRPPETTETDKTLGFFHKYLGALLVAVVVCDFDIQVGLSPAFFLLGYFGVTAVYMSVYAADYTPEISQELRDRWLRTRPRRSPPHRNDQERPPRPSA